MDKRGQVGFNIVTGVLTALLVLVVLVFAVLIITSSLRPVAIAQDRDASTVNNETLTTVDNTTAETFTHATDPNFIMTTSPKPICYNESNGLLLNTTNYTVTASGTIISTDVLCEGILGATSNSAQACGWDWNCTYAFSSTPTNVASDIAGNVSRGLSSFFASIPTIFAVLVAVIIILAVAIIIVVTRRFGAGGRTSASV